ncbi:MAG: universal stress protein [Actinobacteria bacterium]|nr:MAG: universal stress protein [Actinomycetota bacterium]
MATTLDRTAELMTDDDIVSLDLNIKKILCPTDGSATAVEATKVAVSLAKCFGAEVIALFVTPGNVEFPTEYAQTEAQEGVHHSKAGLDVATKLGEKNGVRVTGIERAGAVGHEIIAAAKEYDANLIVMGTEGRTGFKRFALGSVAESVMKEAEIPCMVVRHCSTEFCMTPRG